MESADKEGHEQPTTPARLVDQKEKSFGEITSDSSLALNMPLLTMILDWARLGEGSGEALFK